MRTMLTQQCPSTVKLTFSKQDANCPMFLNLNQESRLFSAQENREQSHKNTTPTYLKTQTYVHTDSLIQGYSFCDWLRKSEIAPIL